MRNKKNALIKKRFTAMLLTGMMTLSMMTVLPTTALTTKAAESYGLSNPRFDRENHTVTYDCVYFGNYWQEDTNGDGEANKKDSKTPIKWRVLSVNGEDAFLIADKNLDVQRYNDTYTDVIWETCTMRSWLNGYGADSNICGKDYSEDCFINHAFSEPEQKAIRNTELSNKDNPHYGTAGGNDTTDKIFLLSLEDIANEAYGFTNYSIGTGNGSSVGEESGDSIFDYAKLRTNTAFTKGSDTASGYAWISSTETGWWWLRTPGSNGSYASLVCNDGIVGNGGVDVDYVDNALCPALHLNLSSIDVWSKAETVTCKTGNISGEDSGEEGEPTTEQPDDGSEQEPTTEQPDDGSEQEPTTEQPDDESEQNVPVSKIAISGISKKIAAGKKIKLESVVLPENATDKSITWTSGNSKFATVNSKGVVTAKKNGIGKTVTITAAANDGSGVRKTYKISIVKHAVKSIRLSAKSKTVAAGKTLKLKASVKTTGKTANKKLKWSSSNKKYATVTNKGVVKAKKAGKGKSVKMKAMATDGTGIKATIKVKIK